MTTVDVGDAVCDRFAPRAWRDIDELWARRLISLPEAQRRMWALVRGSRRDLETYARRVAVPRPGLRELLAAAGSMGYRRVLASGGFDFCMRALLRTLPVFDAVHSNRARFSRGHVTPIFNGEGLGCASCAVCKGEVCLRERAAGIARVVFVGDGLSDRCALGHADAIAAVRGGALEHECRARTLPHLAFDDLAEVIPLLGARDPARPPPVRPNRSALRAARRIRARARNR